MSFVFVILSWFPVGAWAGFIYALSDIPSLSTGLGVWDLLLRKAAHIFEYAVLTFLLLRAFKRTFTSWTQAKLFAWSGVISLLYAISDEIHQKFVPGRGPSALDVIIDSIGIVIVVLIARKYESTS